LLRYGSIRGARLLPIANQFDAPRGRGRFLHWRSHICEVQSCVLLGRSLFFGSGDCPQCPRKLCPGEKMRTGATCSTCSQPTVATSFEGTKLWRLRFFGGAFLLASVIFREPDRARRLAGQSPLPKTRMCNASYSPQLSDFLQPYIIVQRLWQPNRSI
jgi:hypothetical protein